MYTVFLVQQVSYSPRNDGSEVPQVEGSLYKKIDIPVPPVVGMWFTGDDEIGLIYFEVSKVVFDADARRVELWTDEKVCRTRDEAKAEIDRMMSYDWADSS